MEPFIGEIRILHFKQIPADWLRCDGQTYAIADYRPLFAVISNQYGGDGKNNFKVPDLRGCIPIGTGTGSGLTPRNLNDAVGAEEVKLGSTQMPNHSHPLMAAGANGNMADPSVGLLCQGVIPGRPPQAWPMYNGHVPEAPMNIDAIELAGGGGNHENRQPTLALHYCIAFKGVFPTFSDSEV